VPPTLSVGSLLVVDPSSRFCLTRPQPISACKIPRLHFPTKSDPPALHDPGRREALRYAHLTYPHPQHRQQEQECRQNPVCKHVHEHIRSNPVLKLVSNRLQVLSGLKYAEHLLHEILLKVGLYHFPGRKGALTFGRYHRGYIVNLITSERYFKLFHPCS